MARNRYHQGIFKPTNPQKYKGDPTNIIFRSGLELGYMQKLDASPNVLQWCSEETIVNYISPVDGDVHRYFVDMWVKMKVASGEVKEYLIEIKPLSQITPPKPPKRKTKRYLDEVKTFAVNIEKWKAAKQYAEKYLGGEFIIVTENRTFSAQDVIKDYL